MRNRKPSPIHTHRKAEFNALHLSPVQYYMEEELSMEEVAEKIIDCSGEHFFELFKQYNKNFFKQGRFNGVYFYESHFSTMFLFFNEAFYETYKHGSFYALPSSLSGINSFLIKEHYPNETEYLKTAAYLEGISNFKEGSLLMEFMY